MKSEQEASPLTDPLLITIVRRLRQFGRSQIEGYNVFEFAGESENAITVRRENGNTATVSLRKLQTAIAAVRTDPTLYFKGPSALRRYGLSHVTSPIWALLHLVRLEKYQYGA